MKEFIEKLIDLLKSEYDRNIETEEEAFEEQDWEKFNLFRYRNEGVYIAINIINQIETEYTCENCVEKGKCSIYDNADIKYCSDCRPRFKPYKEDDTEGFLNTMQLAEDWNLEITEEQRERLNSLKDRW